MSTLHASCVALLTYFTVWNRYHALDANMVRNIVVCGQHGGLLPFLDNLDGADARPSWVMVANSTETRAVASAVGGGMATHRRHRGSRPRAACSSAAGQCTRCSGGGGGGGVAVGWPIRCHGRRSTAPLVRLLEPLVARGPVWRRPAPRPLGVESATGRASRSSSRTACRTSSSSARRRAARRSAAPRAASAPRHPPGRRAVLGLATAVACATHPTPTPRSSSPWCRRPVPRPAAPPPHLSTTHPTTSFPRSPPRSFPSCHGPRDSSSSSAARRPLPFEPEDGALPQRRGGPKRTRGGNARIRRLAAGRSRGGLGRRGRRRSRRSRSRRRRRRRRRRSRRSAVASYWNRARSKAESAFMEACNASASIELARKGTGGRREDGGGGGSSSSGFPFFRLWHRMLVDHQAPLARGLYASPRELVSLLRAPGTGLHLSRSSLEERRLFHKQRETFFETPSSGRLDRQLWPPAPAFEVTPEIIAAQKDPFSEAQRGRERPWECPGAGTVAWTMAHATTTAPARQRRRQGRQRAAARPRPVPRARRRRGEALSTYDEDTSRLSALWSRISTGAVVMRESAL